MNEFLKDIPILYFKDKKEWTQWLKKNHTMDSSIWIKFSKKDSNIPSVTYAEALEVALCYGWIDSQKQKYDESYWLQKFSIRGKKSLWSQINREKAKDLIADGKMKSPGLKAIDAAKKDGRWDSAYPSASKAAVPKEFQELLNTNSKANAFFTKLDSANRYAILFRIYNAKKPETRTKKMQEFLKMLEKGETIHGFFKK
ncbi:YdeI family protein [Leptospira sp. WS92.C1]